MFVHAPPKLVYNASSSNGGSNLSYPINLDVRKTRSLTSVPYTRNQMVVYPMYGYYAPQAVNSGFYATARKSVMQDSDSSDDDIPLSKVKPKGKKVKGAKPQTSIKCHAKPKANDTDKSLSPLMMHLEIATDQTEENSEITLADSTVTDDVQDDGSKKKSRYFSHLRTLFKSRRA